MWILLFEAKITHHVHSLTLFMCLIFFFFNPELCLRDKGLLLCYEPKGHLMVKSTAHLCRLFLEQEGTDLWLFPDFFCGAYLISLLPKPSNNGMFVLHTVALFLQIFSEYLLGQVQPGKYNNLLFL